MTVGSATWPSQQESTVVLGEHRDGNLLWQASALTAVGPRSRDLLVLGPFGPLVAAQTAAKYCLSLL